MSIFTKKRVIRHCCSVLPHPGISGDWKTNTCTAIMDEIECTERHMTQDSHHLHDLNPQKNIPCKRTWSWNIQVTKTILQGSVLLKEDNVSMTLWLWPSIVRLPAVGWRSSTTLWWIGDPHGGCHNWSRDWEGAQKTNHPFFFSKRM